MILSLDGFTAHFSNYFLDECTYHDIFPLPVPAGTSDQIKPLDLGLFAAQEAIKMRLKNHKDLSENPNNIIRIIDSWQKCSTPSNIVSAFNQAGIYSELTDRGLVTRASLDYARAVRKMKKQSHFQCLLCITKR